MTEATTTIEAMYSDWKRLNARKEPGEGFKDVLSRVLDNLEAAESEGFVPESDEETRQIDPDDFDTFDKIREREEKRAATESDRGGPERIHALVEEMDLPGDGSTLEARRNALVDLHTHLRKKKTAEKSDFLHVIERFDHGYANAESFWSNVVKGKQTLQTLPGVEPPADGLSTWRFDG